MEDNNAQQDKTQAGNGFWRQFVMAVAVVVVALIGAWQVYGAFKSGDHTVAEAAGASPSTSGNSNGVAADVVAATGNPVAAAPTGTGLPGKSVGNVDTSQWYRLTNEAMGPGFALALDPASKQPVIVAADGSQAQVWKFTRIPFSFYTLSTESVTSALVLDVHAGPGYQVKMTNPKLTNTDANWKAFTFGATCNRLTTQWLGESWSLDLQGKGPALQMSHSNFAASQCWHLTPLGPIN